MYINQGPDYLEKACPEFEYLFSAGWWLLILKVILKGAFIRVFQEHVVCFPFDKGSMKSNNAVRRSSVGS